jgi:hypothetical protein
MKVMFYGNCQLQVVLHALRASNEGFTAEYAGITERLDFYDKDRSEELFAWADLVFSQPIMNKANEDYHENLVARFGDRILFMPYIYFPGLFDFTKIVAKFMPTRTGILEEAVLLQHLRARGLRQTLGDYSTGRLALGKAEQFAANLQELARREQLCTIRIAPYYRAQFRERPLMLTHNHPTPEVINEISRMTAAHLGLSYSAIGPDTPATYRSITLPAANSTVLTPFTAADLGLKYPYDLHWFPKGHALIKEVAEAYGIA